MKYRVVWEIDIFAETPLEAAEAARSIQLDPASMATIFEIFTDGTQVKVDLDEEQSA